MRRVLTLTVLLFLAVVTGCGQGDSQSNVAETSSDGSPTTQAALETELVFAFQKQKDPTKIKEDADKVAAYLSKEIGVPVKTFVPTKYSASVEALVSKKADLAYVSSIPFLLARRDAEAELLLAEVRPDLEGKPRTDYDSIFVVRKDSPLKSLDDVVKQAKDLRFAFTSRTSTSGYVMAYGRLVKEGLLKARQEPESAFKTVKYGGSYTAALLEVLEGRADVCAVSYYTVEGPKADRYLEAAKREQLRVLDRTPGVPTHLVCARGGLSAEMKKRVKAALLKLSDEHPELLADVYGAKKLTEVDEKTHVKNAVYAVEALPVPITGLVK